MIDADPPIGIGIGLSMKTYDWVPLPFRLGYFFMVGIYFHGSGLSLNTRQTAHFSIHLVQLNMQIFWHTSTCKFGTRVVKVLRWTRVRLSSVAVCVWTATISRNSVFFKQNGGFLQRVSNYQHNSMSSLLLFYHKSPRSSLYIFMCPVFHLTPVKRHIFRYTWYSSICNMRLSSVAVRPSYTHIAYWTVPSVSKNVPFDGC